MSTWRRGFTSILHRLGLRRRPRVEAISDDAWLLQRPKNPENPLTLQPVDERMWVLQRLEGRRHAVEPIGRENLRTYLLVDSQTIRHRMHGYELALSRYIGAEHIAWILRELRINCVLDVGANIGQYGQRLRSGGYDGRIVSFEPLPHTVERLRQAADGDRNWRIVECALGEAEARAEMTVVDGRGATSSLLAASEFGKSWSQRLEGVRREQVQVRRLDALFDEAVAGISSPRVFLKMDTQGYDLRVFAGAGERIGGILGLQSEVSCVPIYEGMARLPEQISTYEAAGFEITGMFPVTRDRESLRVIEFDAVMIRPEARSLVD